MKVALLTCLLCLLIGKAANAGAEHACASNAILRAKELLVFYAKPDGPWSVDKSAAKIGAVPAIHGRRRYDVLQVWGYVYKSRYRMRFIYGTVGGECVLVGEEIYEDTSL